MTGLIDFGDVHYSLRLMDVAAALAYLLLDASDVDGREAVEWPPIARHFLGGYTARRRLNVDAATLQLAAAARVLTSLVRCNHVPLVKTPSPSCRSPVFARHASTRAATIPPTFSRHNDVAGRLSEYVSVHTTRERAAHSRRLQILADRSFRLLPDLDGAGDRVSK